MPFTEGMCALHPKSQLCTMCPVALYVCSKVQQGAAGASTRHSSCHALRACRWRQRSCSSVFAAHPVQDQSNELLLVRMPLQSIPCVLSMHFQDGCAHQTRKCTASQASAGHSVSECPHNMKGNTSNMTHVQMGKRSLHYLCRYDDLSNYSNERSVFLANLRDAIETPWQAWELEQLPVRRDMSPAEV